MTAPAPQAWEHLPVEAFPSPCFIIDETRLAANLGILQSVRDRAGTRILLALKGFAMFSVFPLLRKTLDGACASSPHEARLGREEFKGLVHTFAAGYSDSDIDELLPNSDHLVFNSFGQYRRFRSKTDAFNQGGGNVECGIRINPEHSEGAVPIYDPCSPGSRLGVRHEAFAREAAGGQLQGIGGLHFHTLCEQNADAFARTLAVVEKKFGSWIRCMRWLNCGGGHLITRPGYDIDLLCGRLNHVRATYGVQTYIEPGAAVALNAGILKAAVLDIVEADMPVAVLDTSATAHMPDVLEMPYRPEALNASGEPAGEAGEKAWTCRLAGKSCLAGDVIGEYSFDMPLRPGDILFFLDMAHYSMVKTTTFNGLGLPGIGKIDLNGKPVMVRSFGYEEFRTRLS